MNAKKTVISSVLLLLSITFLHVMGLVTGMYARAVPIDVPQHILAGVFFAVVWFGIAGRMLKTAPILVTFFSLVAFSAFVGVLWEFFEYGMAQAYPVIAHDFALMSPVVGELLRDLLADMFGGVLFATYVIWPRLMALGGSLRK